MMANKYETIQCEECTAEFDIKVLNEDELNNPDIRFCPCCGRKMVPTIEEEDDGWSVDWDDQDHNSF
jgi:NAD-dependent SIR2 family protein deacetylase